MPRTAPSARHPLAAALAAFTLALAVMVGAQAATPSPAKANPLASAFATLVVKSGATYLTAELRNGLLGEPGQKVGEVLTQAGLYDETPDKIAELRDVIGVELQSVSARVSELRDLLVTTDGHVLQGSYSLAAANAATTIADIKQGYEDLIAVTRETTVAGRVAAAKRFEEFYFLKLHGKDKLLHDLLTSPAPGADGLIVLASKAARGAAQPFFTPQLSELARTVYSYYSLYEGELEIMQINYLQYHGASRDTMLNTLDTAEARLKQEGALLPTATVFPHSVVDVRTNLLWSYQLAVETRRCESNARLAPCTYDFAKMGTLNWLGANSSGRARATNGGFSPEWRLPTAAEMQQLVAGHTTLAGQWLNTVSSTVLPNYTGAIWISGGDPKGSTGTIFNLADGSTGTRPGSEQLGLLMVCPSHLGELKNYFYWYS